MDAPARFARPKRKAEQQGGRGEEADDPRDPDFVPMVEDESDLTAAEKEMNRRGESIDMSSTDVRVLTSNVAKYAASTDQRTKRQKTEALGEILDATNPTVAVFQEVTNAPLFGSDLEALPTGKGGQRAFMEGPAYEANTYHESYPYMVDTARVHQKPKLSVVDPKTGNRRPYKAPLKFGKKHGGTPRPTTMLELQVQAGRYPFRPPRKDDMSTGENSATYEESHKNLAHREPEYAPMSVVNVHTSPSISTITEQVKQIRKTMDGLRGDGHNVVAAGDWYMQESAKTQWKELESSKDWSLAAPAQRTNFPSKGEGQVADMFVVDREKFQSPRATPIAPPQPGASMEDIVAPKTDAELREWTKRGIDHAPVLLDATLTPSPDDL
ncbi:MAG: hypothetical protein U0414_16990 [Polyangiaceae bacterium]